MNDYLMALTSAFQLVAIRFARCKVPRIVFRFHFLHSDDQLDRKRLDSILTAFYLKFYILFLSAKCTYL